MKLVILFLINKNSKIIVLNKEIVNKSLNFIETKFYGNLSRIQQKKLYTWNPGKHNYWFSSN